jgi:Flp pilus assembly protein TadD
MLRDIFLRSRPPLLIQGGEYIAADPDIAGIRINLGARLLQLGDVSGAEKAWREALRLRPESTTLRINLTNLLASRGNFAEAEYYFRAAVRIDPNHVGIPDTANRLPRRE